MTANLTIDVLARLYTSERLSLQEIASRYGCSRQYVQKLMKKFGIPSRSRSAARIGAQAKGRVTMRHQLRDGSTRTTVVLGDAVDPNFFKKASPAMAWVLGAFFSDGCLVESDGVFRATMSQKEPELLQKCLALMGSTAKLEFRPARGIAGAIFTFRITNQTLCTDLMQLGVTPRKSHTVRFPSLRPDLRRHFIRGCWDGDGSIYRQRGTQSRWCASFVTGSEPFAAEVVAELVHLGLPSRTIHAESRSHAFYFRWTGRDVVKLADVFYRDVSVEQFLERKRERFRSALSEISEHRALQRKLW